MDVFLAGSAKKKKKKNVLKNKKNKKTKGYADFIIACYGLPKHHTVDTLTSTRPR